MKFQRAFTLIEVLVALAIVAIALIAGLRASGALTDNALRQSSAFLAQLCAENEQIRIRLSTQLPGIGQMRSECIQADQTFAVAVLTQVTPNPNFRKVSIAVSSDDRTVLQLSAVVGNN